MIGKKWEIVGFYKDMLIYYKTDFLGNKYIEFGNKSFTSARAKNVRSAKILITKYINKLNKREKKSLKYLRYSI